VVYVDNLHLRPFNRNRVAREVRGFLYETLRPEDRVMLVTFERSLHVRQPFTSDPLAIGQALEGIEELSGFAVQAKTERDEVIRRIEGSRTPAEALAHADAHARESQNDTRTSIRGLKELIASLGGLAGRKAVLYVSDGIPMNPGEDLYALADAKFAGEGVGGTLQARRYSVRSEFRELVAHANANRVTLYTLDAGGLRGHASVSAESGGSAAGGSLFEADSARFFNLVEPLEMMAADTGGRAFYNTNNVAGALADMEVDLRSYYSLGYTPAHHGDGRYYRIEVEVKRRGVQVRHRNGYRDKTPSVRLTEGALAALVHAVGVNPLGIDLELLPPRRRVDGFYLVPVEVAIPLAGVTLVPQDGLYHGRLSVVTAVIDREGGTSPPDPIEIPLTVPAAEIDRARTQHFTYAAELLMRPGLHEVAVGLRDELAGESSFVREVVRVGG
jgi:VWFA-related protein